MERSVRNGSKRRSTRRNSGLAKLTLELAQERERCAATTEALSATADLLKAVSSSTFDLQTVLESLCATALRLSTAERVFVVRLEGEHLHYMAGHGISPEFRNYLVRHPIPLARTTFSGRCALDRRTVHVADAQNDPNYKHGGIRVDPYRTVLCVPMCKGQHVIGAFCVYHHEVRPFTDSQIALMETFADQAVIAMENARLITEQREALEQQTATADVLKIISRSSVDLKSVLDTLADTAARLCRADHALMFRRREENLFHLVASPGISTEAKDYFLAHPIAPDRGTITGRVVLERRAVHIADVLQDPEYTYRSQTFTGSRTSLGIPLLREDALVGIFVIARHRVEPFTDKEIELVTTFADQAVIAIENARLFEELRDRTGDLEESLEYQTATSDVLKVISRSAFDLQTVLNTLVDTAGRLCQSDGGGLAIRDGDVFRYVALHGETEEFGTFLRQQAFTPGRKSGTARVLLEGKVVHIPDVTVDPEYTLHEMVTLGGWRSYLGVPLLRDGGVVGVITVNRRRAEPFTERQVELIRTFADQAVIAMENARLFEQLRTRTDDLQESLKYQTATSDVLKIISRSTFDLQPILDTLVETAVRLCGANEGGLTLRDGEVYRYVAWTTNTSPDHAAALRGSTFEPGRGSVVGRVALEGKVIHIADVRADPEYNFAPGKQVSGTLLGVPLLRDTAVVGTLTLSRQHMEPFTERQIELVRTFADQAVIAMENARLMTETRESLERQTATSEVLQVINTSPGDVKPVFDAMLGKALTLCDATFGILWIYDGEHMHASSLHGVPPEFAEYLLKGPHPVGYSNAHARLMRGEPMVHILDVKDDEAYRSGDPVRRAFVDLGRARSMLAVPLRKDERFLGAFIIYRQEVKPFSDKQIALAQNFAAQAVIAMENARLMTETRESLARQTATSEVLQVINASPGDVRPVFDAMLGKALALCDALNGIFWTFHGDQMRIEATAGNVPEAEFFAIGRTYPIGTTNAQARLIRGERFVHILDVSQEHAYQAGDEIRRVTVEVLGVRTLLAVPLRKEGTYIGAIIIDRTEVKPFTERQIALLESFAAQAVIAMENARLLTEQREALERQTATAEVLQIINSSPGNLAPVFDAILERAMRVCGAAFGGFGTYGAERFAWVAERGVPPPFSQYVATHEASPGPRAGFLRVASGAGYVHFSDIRDSKLFRDGDPFTCALVELGRGRTTLSVPLVKNGELLGVFGFFRQEVKPFSEREIALLLSFAAQAVIAMENARLLGELRERTGDLEESLKYQTATSDVLKVISGSAFELQPVLDTLIETAGRLCGATRGHILQFDGEFLRFAAAYGAWPEFVDYLEAHPVRPGAGTVSGRAAFERRTVHVSDVLQEPGYEVPELSNQQGYRTVLAVPMFREEVLRGVITMLKTDVEPFTERQIELIRTFADQAVIAIENARLLGELRERTGDLEESLKYQTATSDVLKVISGSAFELQPVLDSVVETAANLCDADFAGITLRDGGVYRYVALSSSTSPEYIAELRGRAFGRDRGSVAGRVALEGKVIHVADITTDPDYDYAAAVNIGKIRTLLGVPMFRENEVIGVIGLSRQRVEPFTDRQVELIRTFADQAVIAIANARLLTEQRESLEQQTATAEVLGVISSAPGQLQPVFEKLLESALRLCNAHFGSINRVVDGVSNEVVRVGAPEITFTLSDYRPPPHSPYGQMLATKSTIRVRDYAETQGYAERAPAVVALVEQLHGRSALQVPFVRKDEVVGAITIYRPEVRPFSNKEVALVENFAKQGVIAIENARLLSELRERQAELARSVDELTATSDVLKIISRSTVDLKTVLDTLVDTVVRLCRADQAGMYRLRDDGWYMIASHGLTEEAQEYQRTHPLPTDRGSMSGRTGLARRAVHIHDVLEDPEYTYREGAKVTGYRTLLGVPLLRGDTVVGTTVVARKHVEPFSDKEIELVATFADQAVIAIENARLVEELRESLEQQTATAEVLQVINNSPGDVKPVFDAILDKALSLCHSAFGAMRMWDGTRFHLGAQKNLPQAYLDFSNERMATLTGIDALGARAARVLTEKRVLQIVDAKDTDAYRSGDVMAHAIVDLAGARTMLFVPLVSDDAVARGTIMVLRTEVRPFSDKEIALVQSFAAQAVIAMDNARLLGELRESLEQQTATAEVLQVINTSPGELKPVFDAILDKALSLSHSAFGTMRTFDGTRFQLAAQKNVPQAYLDFTAKRITNLVGVNALGTGVAQVITERRVLQYVDVKDTDLYRSGDPMRRAVVDLAGARTILFVPLLDENAARGVIMVFRTEVRAYSEKEIALLQNFAAQAVIAMDNARLLGELRERQAELRVTFDNMGDGVALFDATLRLAAWNRNFQTILDLPDALLESRLTYQEYIRMLAERGEFGSLDNIEEELARRMGSLDRQALFARTRPDGKVIEARRNPVPGGGFVLIYSDITERKRAEAEISAARDAAEKALRELQTAQASLLHSQKMAALGQLTAGIAHEIKNPLNFVNNFADLSGELLEELKEATPDRSAEIDETIDMLSSNLAKIAEHGRRADGIVKSMLAHSRGGSGDRQPTDLNALVEEALNLAYHGARAQDQRFNITMERALDPALKPVEVVPQDFMRVLLNLFGNGFYAAHKRSQGTNGEFKPTLRVATTDLGEHVEIRVRDNGIGIAPEHRDRLFQPFFTTKPTGEGTGLGLSISFDIVTQQHGGTIACDSVVGEFTEFVVRLPRRKPY